MVFICFFFVSVKCEKYSYSFSYKTSINYEIKLRRGISPSAETPAGSPASFSLSALNYLRTSGTITDNSNRHSSGGVQEHVPHSSPPATPKGMHVYSDIPLSGQNRGPQGSLFPYQQKETDAHSQPDEHPEAGALRGIDSRKIYYWGGIAICVVGAIFLFFLKNIVFVLIN